ncbi:unconventional myosin-XIX-like isoform X2 [Venturia canescens]|uniref:unconventional myosin-XIX-like isoform X2 n=1 Tax=Venturia canescens TaxID=32260 RepID=UPI001C9C9D39|nr:unconventional myosin-XIX-like isoform X2 [Venturia canescens]
MQEYFAQEDKNDPRNSTPHVYAVANRARYRLVHGFGKINQVIVISGESGAGKTFNARRALDFLAARNEIVSKTSHLDIHADKSCKTIIHKIANVIPLVSAFTTARTTRNMKSSRHGQMLRLQYDERCVIRGASIHSFLFERTRVTECSDNFEIFYQLLYGLSEEEIAELLLSRDQNYTVLGIRNSRDSCSLAEEFRETVASFKALDFTDECRVDIFRVIAFLVHLGNIRFDKTIGEGISIDLANEDSKNALKNACSLISLPEYELTQLLTSTIICPQSSGGRHSSYRRYFKTTDDCRNRLFSIARFIYDRLFNRLVERVNEILHDTGNNYNWLGLLDIFGFESFDYNGLEQLCINYATERLQLYFMEDYLEAGQRELEEEGLVTLPTSVSIELYRDRIFVIENIVFSTFDDASRSPIALKSSTLLQQMHAKQKGKSGFLVTKNNVFMIEHYSCPVEYNVNNLLSKNTDKLLCMSRYHRNYRLYSAIVKISCCSRCWKSSKKVSLKHVALAANRPPLWPN